MCCADAPTWVDTDTTSLAILSGITDLGLAEDSTPMRLMVSLKLRNSSVLYGLAQHLMTPGDALFGHYLSPTDFAAAYSPTVSEANQVIGYLRVLGFKNITLSPNRTVIRMDGTAGLARAAFNAPIHRVTLKGKEVLINVARAQVPSQLASTVLSVHGLNTIQTLSVHPRTQDPLPSTNSLSGYYAPQYQAAYDADPARDGSGVSIAIIAEGDLSKVLPGDLRAYEDDPKNALPHAPYTIIQTGFDHTDASGADEFDLDTQSSTGLAGNVKMLYVYDGSALNDIELIDELNHYVTDDLAVAASESIGGCESTTYAFGELSAYDQVFIQMATQGQSLFASTGDSGGSCLNPAGNGIPAGVPGVEFPGSSTYVMGVGGTTLLVNADNTYYSEVAWNSGGGGTSVFEQAGSWQLPVLPTGATSAAGTAFKGVPDMAMDADPNTGGIVYVAGAPETIGGTSLASPLALGAWARLQSANGGKLGFAPPDLYAMSTAPLTAANGFHDIIAGDNVPYSATLGWDYTTGLGSFDIKALSALLKSVKVTLPTLAPLGGNPCTLPGDLVATGATGGEVDALAAHNVLNVYVAEPDPATTANVDTFTFTLTAADLSNIPPDTAYFVYFVLPDGSEYYVAYESTPATGASSPFTYGKIVVAEAGGTPATPSLLINYVPIQEGYADTGSTLDTANNKITFVLSKKKIDTYTEDQKLSQVYGEADIETTPIADNMGATTAMGTNEVVNDTPEGNYTPIGNAACVAGATPIGGTTTGGTTPGGTSSGGSTTGGTGTSPVASGISAPSADARLGGGGVFGPWMLAGFGLLRIVRRRFAFKR
jgi:hypothetical protein